jgi:hypothetical protein
MPSSAPAPFGQSRWPIFGPLLAGAALSLLALLWMPWERVHPSDASLREPIGYAPCWSHRFASVAGAHIDWTSLLINLAIIWVICCAGAVMLSMSARRD